jgi:hypothetical protein
MFLPFFFSFFSSLLFFFLFFCCLFFIQISNIGDSFTFVKRRITLVIVKLRRFTILFTEIIKHTIIIIMREREFVTYDE